MINSTNENSPYRRYLFDYQFMEHCKCLGLIYYEMFYITSRQMYLSIAFGISHA